MMKGEGRGFMGSIAPPPPSYLPPRFFLDDITQYCAFHGHVCTPYFPDYRLHPPVLTHRLIQVFPKVFEEMPEAVCCVKQWHLWLSVVQKQPRKVGHVPFLAGGHSYRRV